MKSWREMTDEEKYKLYVERGREIKKRKLISKLLEVKLADATAGLKNFMKKDMVYMAKSEWEEFSTKHDVLVDALFSDCPN